MSLLGIKPGKIQILDTFSAQSGFRLDKISNSSNWFGAYCRIKSLQKFINFSLLHKLFTTLERQYHLTAGQFYASCAVRSEKAS